MMNSIKECWLQQGIHGPIKWWSLLCPRGVIETDHLPCLSQTMGPYHPLHLQPQLSNTPRTLVCHGKNQSLEFM